MANLNSFYRKLVDAKPATDVNPEGNGGLNKDHFALIQEHLFFAEIIFPKIPNNSHAKFLGKFLGANSSGNNIFVSPNGDLTINDDTLIRDAFNPVSTNGDLTIPLLIRSVTLPNVSTNSTEDEINNDFGKVVFPSKGTIIPDQNVITIQFLNTEQNILEHLLFDWILETKSNVWVYETYPFTRATIRINYLDQRGHSIIFSYDFHGAFPIQYDTINSTHEIETNLERGATFTFNWFDVDTSKRRFINTSQLPPQFVITPPKTSDEFKGFGDDVRNDPNKPASDTDLEDIGGIVGQNQFSGGSGDANINLGLQDLSKLFPKNAAITNPSTNTTSLQDIIEDLFN